MNGEKSVTTGTTPRRTLRKVKTKVRTKKAVIRTVPTKASSAAFLSVMFGSMNAARVVRKPVLAFGSLILISIR
jgi:hypothetical protein